MDDRQRALNDDVVAAALRLVAQTSERAIRRTDQVRDRITVPRSALLSLRAAIERAYPGGEATARRIIATYETANLSERDDRTSTGEAGVQARLGR